MFKQVRWWSEKQRIKAVFKLQFHASQVTQVGGEEGLIISVVPGDTGKPSSKSDKAAVQDGSCVWENPIYETLKFNRDPKSGKIHQRVYYFILGTGSSKSGVVGEASIDFSNYAEASKISSVSLPLKNSKSEALLHVSIQRVHESLDQREIEENENANLYSKDNLGNDDGDETVTTHSVKNPPQLNTTLRASSGSDITMSSSGSSSGLETPWEVQTKNETNDHHEHDGYLSPLTTPGPKSESPSLAHQDQRRSWEWLRDSALEGSPNDIPTRRRETFLDEQLGDDPGVLIERLKADVAALSRQADMSEMELQTLRKQISKESKRGQELWREVGFLREERDALKEECEKLKGETKTNFFFDGVEELRQELSHATELNTNLRIQLQKTQESNSELILAVGDLEEMLEQRNKDMMVPSSGSLDVKARGVTLISQLNDNDDDDDDEEQKALDDIVKDHGEGQESFQLDVVDLQTEIEMYKRDKEDLEMQMEQLALDYEILKQANHDMVCKLEQSQIHEQLEMHYECSSPDVEAYELGTRVESLENELQSRRKEHEDALVTISELRAHVEGLEKEVQRQARGFEADMEALTRSKVEQEQRAIRAEEALKKMRWKNANAAERLQDEFRKLSIQMASTFEANEKLANKALSEANELRVQKTQLEETLRRISEEHQSVEGHYEARLHEVTMQVTSMASQIEKLELDIEDRGVQLERHRKLGEETQSLLSNEILMLREEIEEQVAKNKILSEEMGNKEAVMHELEKMRMLVKERELLVEQANDVKRELEGEVTLMKREAELRSLSKEKELRGGDLQKEVDSLQAQCTELKRLLSVDEAEKEDLRKQVLQLKSELKKKTRDGNRATAIDVVKAASKTSKPVPRGSKEAVASLKEKIKLLESEIKLKETALEKSANAFSEKEKALQMKIEELEERHVIFRENEVAKPVSEGRASNVESSEEACKNLSTTSSANHGAILSRNSNEVRKDASDVEESKRWMGLVMERNKLMEKELKEMQERYSDMSLKFAEVEGERQELVMKLRNLMNTKNSSNSTNR